MVYVERVESHNRTGWLSLPCPWFYTCGTFLSFRTISRRPMPAGHRFPSRARFPMPSRLSLPQVARRSISIYRDISHTAVDVTGFVSSNGDIFNALINSLRTDESNQSIQREIFSPYPVLVILIIF